MGYFSWLTADKKESIRANKEKNVFLLQPNDTPIKESFYEGFGDFGGIDSFEWLAKMNLPDAYMQKAKEIMEKNVHYELRTIGIYLDSDFYIDSRTDIKYCYEDFVCELFNFKSFINYESTIDGLTVNQLIKKGIFIPHSVSEMINGIKYPLKFSYSENAKYEELPASEICPDQGFF